MTLEDAEKVAWLIAQADGQCRSCTEDLVHYAKQVFPEFKWVMVLGDIQDDPKVDVSHAD